MGAVRHGHFAGVGRNVSAREGAALLNALQGAVIELAELARRPHDDTCNGVDDLAKCWCGARDAGKQVDAILAKLAEAGL